MDEGQRYCMCCGEDVPTVIVEREGRTELNCVHCGFTLDIQAPAGAPAPPEPATTQPAAPEPPPAPVARPAVPCIIAVDDADAHRSVLTGLLERSGLAREVVALNSGAELVTTIARRFADNRPVDLVILDVEMPAMDGFTAARFLRALEKRLRRPPCPVVFFTGRRADENLRHQMSLLRPAWYCAKTGSGFERRATALIGHIAELLSASGA